jgi:hypothetical protein
VALAVPLLLGVEGWRVAGALLMVLLLGGGVAGVMECRAASGEQVMN